MHVRLDAGTSRRAVKHVCRDAQGVGHSPLVEIETPAGRAEYVREQSAIADRGVELRGEGDARADELATSRPDLLRDDRVEPTVKDWR